MVILIGKKYCTEYIDTKKPNFYLLNHLDYLETIYNEYTVNNPNNPDPPMLIIIGKFLVSSKGCRSTNEFINKAKQRKNCILIFTSCEIEKINLDKLELPATINLDELINKITEAKRLNAIEEIIINNNLQEFRKLLEKILQELNLLPVHLH